MEGNLLELHQKIINSLFFLDNDKSELKDPTRDNCKFIHICICIQI